MRGSSFIPLISFAAFLVGWHLLATYLVAELPTPIVTGQTFLSLVTRGEPVLGRTLQTHTWASLLRVLLGAGIAFSLAIPLGILMGCSPRWEQFLNPMVEALRPIAPLAWIPLAFVLFRDLANTRIMVQTLVIFVGAFFPGLLNTIHGTKTIDDIYYDVARAHRASGSQILLKVTIPAALPSIVTGVRIGLGVGWMSVVAAEMIGGSASGVGFFLWSMYTVGGGTASIVAGMIAVGIVGYLLNEGIIFLSARFMRWV